MIFQTDRSHDVWPSPYIRTDTEQGSFALHNTTSKQGVLQKTLTTAHKYLGQGCSSSLPPALHASLSSSSGQSFPVPTATLCTPRRRLRKPGASSPQLQVCEQALHADHSDVSQSLAMTQDLKVKGMASCTHRLREEHSQTAEEILLIFCFPSPKPRYFTLTHKPRNPWSFGVNQKTHLNTKSVRVRGAAMHILHFQRVLAAISRAVWFANTTLNLFQVTTDVKCTTFTPVQLQFHSLTRTENKSQAQEKCCHWCSLSPPSAHRASCPASVTLGTSASCWATLLF